MKFLEKVALIVYSNIMIILAVAICLISFGWLDFDLVSNIVKSIITNENYSLAILIGNIFIILLSIKCIFFDSSSRKEMQEKQGVLLQNGNGKLMISKDTLENIVNNVARGFEGTEEVTTRVEVDKESDLKVFVNLLITQDVVIKELSVNLQNKIKEAIKKCSDLEVKEVNVRVNNIAQSKKQ